MALSIAVGLKRQPPYAFGRGEAPKGSMERRKRPKPLKWLI
jgi:hypothetical protein